MHTRAYPLDGWMHRRRFILNLGGSRNTRLTLPSRHACAQWAQWASLGDLVPLSAHEGSIGYMRHKFYRKHYTKFHLKYIKPSFRDYLTCKWTFTMDAWKENK